MGIHKPTVLVAFVECQVPMALVDGYDSDESTAPESKRPCTWTT